jgi:DNA-binding response OmpR family regulator
MKILVVDPSAERRTLVFEALSWSIDECHLVESESLEQARESLSKHDFRVVIVGPDLPEDTLAALVFLRGKLPHSALLTCTKMSSRDREGPTRLLNSGADLVFDERMSPVQLSLTLRPYLGRPANGNQIMSSPDRTELIAA